MAHRRHDISRDCRARLLAAMRTFRQCLPTLRVMRVDRSDLIEKYSYET
jgi:hypothetical protein